MLDADFAVTQVRMIQKIKSLGNLFDVSQKLVGRNSLPSSPRWPIWYDSNGIRALDSKAMPKLPRAMWIPETTGRALRT